MTRFAMGQDQVKVKVRLSSRLGLQQLLIIFSSLFRNLFGFSAYVFKGKVKVVAIKTVPHLDVMCHIFYAPKNGSVRIHVSKGEAVKTSGYKQRK